MFTQLMVPINSNGIITDLSFGQEVTATADIAVTRLFILCHGWWTTADECMSNYNRMVIGLQTRLTNAAIAATMHWPSMLDENGGTLANLIEPLSFYTMEKRADTVGQHAGATIIELLAAAHPELTQICLVGHSFGCKVVCSAIQNLPGGLTLPPIDVALLEPATWADDLSSRGSYSDVAGEVNRILVTTSEKDTVLQRAFPAAEAIDLFNHDAVHQAMGAVGPTGVTALGTATQVAIAPGFVRASVPAGRLLVADLTPIHTANPIPTTQFVGQHSNIYLPEIFELLAGFFSPPPPTVPAPPAPGAGAAAEAPAITPVGAAVG